MKRTFSTCSSTTSTKYHKTAAPNEYPSSVTSRGSSDSFNDETCSNDTEKDDYKRKSRNLSEKKRRDQFNLLINELSSMVNYDASTKSSSLSSTNQAKKMDKSSVLRLTITYLRNHCETNHPSNKDFKSEGAAKDPNQCSQESEEEEAKNIWKPGFLSFEEFLLIMLEGLDAFIIVFEANSKGKIIYASESIMTLGYSPSNICFKKHVQGDDISPNFRNGLSIFEMIHESEKEDLKNLISNRLNMLNGSYTSFMLHFRQGDEIANRNTEPTYELVRLTGTFYHISENDDADVNCCVAIGRLQIPKLLRELRMTIPQEPRSKNNEFISRHSLEWKFLFLDHRAPVIIGYLPFEVLGTSGYDYYHWDDLDTVVSGHEQLMQTGEGTSSKYRFLTKGQQWIWLQTRYFITYHQWNSKPEFIVCTHTVIGYDNNTEGIKKERKNIERTSIAKSNDKNITSSESQPVITTSTIQPVHSKIDLKRNKKSTLNFHDFKSVDCSSMMNSPTKAKIFKYSPTNIQSENHSRIYQKQVISATQTRELDTRFSLGEIHPTSELIPNESINSQSIMLSNISCPNIVSLNTILPPNLEAQTMHMAQSIESSQVTSPHVDSQVTNQENVQDYLRRKHQLLQEHIQQQQEELRRVSEQLIMVQYVDIVPENSNLDAIQSVPSQISQKETNPNQIAISNMSYENDDITPLTTVFPMSQEEEKLVFHHGYDQ